MSAPERVGVIAAQLLARLAAPPDPARAATTAHPDIRIRQETEMTTTDVQQHEPITLLTGDVFCLEGECDHATEFDENATDTDPCPLLAEVAVCKACSTVTKSPYGDEWGPIVEWPCPSAT